MDEDSRSSDEAIPTKKPRKQSPPLVKSRHSKRLKFRRLRHSILQRPNEYSSPRLAKAMLKIEKVDASKRPNELIRCDFITAMKIPDGHQIHRKNYWEIKDRWKAVWNRGVHVPISNKFAKDVYKTIVINEAPTAFVYGNWITRLYEIDSIDNHWIDCISRFYTGFDGRQFERIMIALEFNCTQQMRYRVSENLTFDNNVVCDVCLKPDSEDSDQIVFCDGCNLCVHQSCYGISEVPKGDWMCNPCSDNISHQTIQCILCPVRAGALKPVQCSNTSANLWCHVPCALWIPETSIADLTKMEPIIGVDTIPHARWSLLCYLCKLKEGACIQCDVKSCLKAFHVCCAMEHGLDMKIINRSRKNDHLYTPEAQFIGFCIAHSTNFNSNKKKKALTIPPEILNDFYNMVDVKKIAFCLDINEAIVDATHKYWRDKRKMNEFKPLIVRFPTSKPCDRNKWQELHEYLGMDCNPDKTKMKFILLRQHLESTRNLCYLIIRREKLKQSMLMLAKQKEKLCIC